MDLFLQSILPGPGDSESILGSLQLLQLLLQVLHRRLQGHVRGKATQYFPGPSTFLLVCQYLLSVSLIGQLSHP